MTLRIDFRKPAPTCCQECEFSFNIDDPYGRKPVEDINSPTRGLSCCVHDNTHHPHNQPLCPWYVRANTHRLEQAFTDEVLPWILALRVLDLPEGAHAEAIANVLKGRTPDQLSKPRGE